MSATPAAQLARLKVTYQDWELEKRPNGQLVGRHRDRPAERPLIAATTAELESLLLRDAFDHRSGAR